MLDGVTTDALCEPLSSLSFPSMYAGQCLCMVVDAACKKNCETFQTLLDNLLLMLHTYVSVDVSTSSC